MRALLGGYRLKNTPNFGKESNILWKTHCQKLGLQAQGGTRSFVQH